MRRTRLRSLGLVLVVLGAAVLLAPTLGFDEIDAERSVSANATANPNAQLGLQEDYDDTQIQYSEAFLAPPPTNATVANVTNRVGNLLTVDAQVASIQGGGVNDAVLEVSNDGGSSAPLATNDTVPIRLGCSQQVSGTATDATVELAINGVGDPVSVQDATIAVEGISFSCEGAGGGDGGPPEDPVPIDDVGLQIVGQPTAQEVGTWFSEYSDVTWELQNTGGDPVTITGIHVADSSAGSRIQGGDDELFVTADTNGYRDVTDGISIGSTAPQYDLDQDATIVGGQTADFELGEFRSGNNLFTRVDMRGQTFTVVLMVEGLDVAGRDDPVPVEMTITPS